MPSSITHTYFGIDVYNKLNDSCKSRIDGSFEYFKTFCQGPDVFYFYNLFLGKSAKEVYNIGSIVHTKDTRKFFINLIHTISNNNLESNKSVMSFLYGYMCHYFLDTTCHPFVYYKTGKFDIKDKLSYKYNTKHADMEFFIDRFLIKEKGNMLPYKYKVYKQFLNINDMDNDLRKVINYAFNIYKFNNNDIDKIYLKSIKDMQIFFRLFCYDCVGIKLKFYTLIDFVTPIWFTKVKSLSYSGDYIEKISYLNLDKQIWNHPCDKNKKYSYSFMELYDKALEQCVIAIEIVDKMIVKKSLDEKKLSDIFKNLSYLSGLDCDSNLDMRYFEF